MSSKTEATIEDLYRVPGKAELVGGEIVLMSPTGRLPNYAAGEVFASLREYARRTKRGHASTDNLGFVVDLPHRKSFSPDAAYYLGSMSMKFAEGAPVFAVEVRSEDDYGPAADREMADKRNDYFTAGSQVVWDVDLEGPDVVRVFRASDPDHPTVYRRGQIAEAEPAVPGWTMPVDDLFPEEES
jgi:Uma2 family endonuclease